jgi:hypothetical protein
MNLITHHADGTFCMYTYIQFFPYAKHCTVLSTAQDSFHFHVYSRLFQRCHSRLEIAYRVAQARSWGKSQQIKDLAGCLQLKNCME